MVVLALLMELASATEARVRHKAGPKCPPAGAHTITADPWAQVYLSNPPISLTGPFLGWPPFNGPSGGGGVEHETLAGAMVAYTEDLRNAILASASEPVSRCGTSVYVRDLRTGRLVHHLKSGVKLRPHIPWQC